MPYKSLRIQNFTVFPDADFTFSKGINAYVGVNGSGKTHLLKLLYALQKHQVLYADATSREPLDVTLMSVFNPDSLGRLVRRQRGVQRTRISATWNAKTLEVDFSSRDQKVDRERLWKLGVHPVLIPAKDILGHSVNFADAYDSTTVGGGRWLDFDVTFRDLLTHANPDVPRGPVPAEQQPLLEVLREQMSGTVVKSKTGRFYLKDSAGKIEFPLVAEGWRKLGLLWVLIRNGSLTKGSALYWDEPESNLNPAMFPMIADILAQLARSGTQLHIATHSYALIREMEFAARRHGSPLQYFSLDRNTRDVTVRPCKKFADLTPNPILDEYERIYRLAVEEALANV